VKASLVIAALLLTGCAAIDRPELSRFEPDGTQEGQRAFRFYARADSLIYRVDTPEGEAARMRWLDSYIDENKFCARGYQIDSREIVTISTGLANVHDLFYKGRCKA
jgi:hypothetical protein